MKLSLNNKINLIITLVVITIMLLFGTFTVFQKSLSLKKELYESLDEITIRLSVSLSESVWNIDSRLMVATINSEKNNRDIYSIVVRENYENAVVYSTVRNNKWEFVEGYEEQQGEGFIFRKADIIKNEEKIGEVEVVMSNKFLNEKVFNHLVNVVVPLVIVLITLIVVLGVAVSMYVVKPLSVLSRVSRTIAMGDLDYPINVDRADEIGDLAGSFAKMRNSVKEKIDNLNKAKKQITDSNFRFSTVMDSVDALVFVTDVTSNDVLFINEYGRNKWEGVVGMKCWEVMHPNSAGSCPYCATNYHKDEVETPSATHVWEHMVAEKRWYEFRDRAIRWPDGRKVKLTIATEITDRKEAQQAIYENEAKFRMISEQSKMGIFITKDGAFKYCNKAFADIVRYSVDEILAFDKSEFEKLVYGDDIGFVNRQSKLLESGEGGEASNYQCRLVTSQGDIKWVNVFARSVPYESGLGNLVAVFDVTDDKIHEIERERLLKFIEAKNEELESVVYVSSHDLRTPLVNIQGFVTELSMSVDDLFEYAEEKLKKEELEKFNDIQNDVQISRDYILNNVAKQSELLNSLVKVSRLGRRKVVRKVENANEIVKSIIDSMAYEIQQNSIEVTVGDLPEFFGDRSILNQVFLNLISNSMKYRSDRPCKIKITGAHRSGVTEYCIEDNGIGIKKTAIDNIFNLFYRIDEKKSGGEGIGLSIVKRGVMMNGGKIRVESEFGEWTKFYITLPDKENSFPV